MASIIHVDMDAFFASVEERENPQLKGQPLVVGGAADSRGVVAAANYAARRFGVFSAMPMSTALRKCPHVIRVPARGKLYAAISAQIHEIFQRYTPLIEPLSLDEAFLDVGGSEKLHGSAVQIGKAIKQAILHELNLVASVGIAPNKFLAKLASDHDKPNGFTVVKAEDVNDFLNPMPVKRLWGVGKRASAELARMGIHHIVDLHEYDHDTLGDWFGENGRRIWELSRGIDKRQVVAVRDAKSVSQETTFNEDISQRNDILTVASQLTEQVGYRLRMAELLPRTVQIKLRYSDFRTITRSHTMSNPSNQTKDLSDVVQRLIKQNLAAQHPPLRLVGVGTSQFTEQRAQQDIFNVAPAKHNELDKVADVIREKYGFTTVQRAAALNPGSDSKADTKSGAKKQP